MADAEIHIGLSDETMESMAKIAKPRKMEEKKTFIFSGGGINCHFEIEVNAESLDEAMELISERLPPDKSAFGVIDVDEKPLCVCCLLGK